MAGILPLVLVTTLLAEQAPEWREHPARAAGAPDAPGRGAADAAGAWLAALDVPSAGELHDTVSLVAATEAEDDEAAVDDTDEDADMGDDAGGDSSDSDSE